MFRLAALLALLAGASPALADDAALWRALASGGHVALMRHATAPGTGDPADFRIGDCATQRNLSEEGRAEARAIGERFRRNGVAVARIATSQWCRCRDTAREMALGAVVEDFRLNSFFGGGAEAAARAVEGVRAAIAEAPRSGPIAVLVTHQVNVTAATGVYPASGEIVVLRAGSGGEAVVGTIRP